MNTPLPHLIALDSGALDHAKTPGSISASGLVLSITDAVPADSTVEYSRYGIAGTVYLLHFERPYYHARHYVGWTTNLASRMRRHRSGAGSPLVRAVIEEGIEFQLARVWHNVSRRFERRCHATHNVELCPICTRPDAQPMNPRVDPRTGIGH